MVPRLVSLGLLVLGEGHSGEGSRSTDYSYYFLEKQLLLLLLLPREATTTTQGKTMLSAISVPASIMHAVILPPIMGGPSNHRTGLSIIQAVALIGPPPVNNIGPIM